MGVREPPFPEEDAIDDVVVALHEVEERASVPVDTGWEQAVPE